MTKCTTQSFSFSPLGRKKITASFSEGTITSDGGLMLLREVDKQLKLTKQLSACIDDQRDPSYVDHSIEAMLKQRIYAIAAGYEDVNDHDCLRNDLAFQTMVSKEQPLASSATLSRFENSVTRKECVNLSNVLIEHFIASQKTVPQELILDFDPTDYRIHGHQEHRHFHGYYAAYCYLPLYVFCGDQLLVSYLRPSNIDGAMHASAILKLVVKRFRQVWPDVKITFRGDCAFARKCLFQWCENNHVDYVVGIAQNPRLLKETNAFSEQTEKHFHQTQQKQHAFTEFYYQAESWKRSRRIIAKAEYHEKGSNIRFIITNKTESPSLVYDDHYCQRGETENYIKQQKLDLRADRVSCQSFMANQFRVLLSAFAYTLLTALRQAGLKATELAASYCQTLRNKLLKVGAIVIKNSRRIQFIFSSHYPQQALFQQVVERLVPS